MNATDAEIRELLALAESRPTAAGNLRYALLSELIAPRLAREVAHLRAVARYFQAHEWKFYTGVQDAYGNRLATCAGCGARADSPPAQAPCTGNPEYAKALQCAGEPPS